MTISAGPWSGWWSATIQRLFAILQLSYSQTSSGRGWHSIQDFNKCVCMTWCSGCCIKTAVLQLQVATMKESFRFDCLQVLIAARYDFLLGRCYFLFCLCVLGLHERICPTGPINSDLFALQIRSNELEQSGLTTHTDIFLYIYIWLSSVWQAWVDSGHSLVVGLIR